MKCQSCKQTEAITGWQPFGPDSTVKCFPALGWHYRGFPVIKICDECQNDIENERPVEFTYREIRYITDGDKILRVPAHVTDALLWREEQF